MGESARNLGAVFGASILAFAAMTGVGFAGATAADPGVALSCVGNASGAAYVTDSGLTAYENDSDVTSGTFGGSESVTFGNLTLSAAGNATVRVDDAGGSSDPVCLANVDASANAVTIAPNSTTSVVLDGNASAFTYRDPVYDPSDTGVDLAVAAGGSVALTVQSTGLPVGETVVATAEGDGTELDRTDVDANESLALALPDGAHGVDLHTVAATPGGGDDTGGTTDDDRPDVTIRTANVSQTTVEVGGTTAVNATLATDGTRSGDYTVALRVDGVHVRNETVRLPAEGNRTVRLTHSFESPGEYTLGIGTHSLGSVTVEPEETTTSGTADGSGETSDTADGETSTGPGTPSAERTSDGNGPGFGTVAAGLALLVTALFARRWY